MTLSTQQTEVHGRGGAPAAEEPEPILKVTVIRDRLAELEGLCRDVADAGETYKAAIAATAKLANCKPGVLRRLVKARIAENAGKARTEAEQLVLLFDRIGT
jgi:hypothetical protein